MFPRFYWVDDSWLNQDLIPPHVDLLVLSYKLMTTIKTIVSMLPCYIVSLDVSARFLIVASVTFSDVIHLSEANSTWCLSVVRLMVHFPQSAFFFFAQLCLSRREDNAVVLQLVTEDIWLQIKRPLYANEQAAPSTGGGIDLRIRGPAALTFSPGATEQFGINSRG